MYKNSANLRKAVSELGKALKDQLAKSWELIRNALQKLMPDIKNASDLFKKLGDFVAKYIMPPLTIWYTFLIKLATFFVVYFIGNLTIFINYIKGFVGLWIGLFQAIRTGSFDPLKVAFENFVDGIIDGVNTLIDALNILNPFKDIPYVPYMNDARRATQELEKTTVPLTDAQEAVKRKMEETAASAANLNVEFGSLKDIQAKLRGEAENVFDEVTIGARNFINARDAARSFKEETDKLSTTLKDNTLDQKQQIAALDGYATSVLDAIKKDIELGGTFESTSKIMEDGTAVFLKNAEAVLGTADAAEALAKNMNLTPETLKKTFEVSGIKKLQELTRELGYLETLANTATGREDMGGMGERMKTIRAEINTKMQVSFGSKDGQDSTSALWVNVANAQAKGGPVSQGKTYLVGEKGPEFFKAPTSGNIIPNNQLSSVNTGGSSPVVNVYPAQGMDEVELAHSVSRQLAWTMRRGA
jgi:hypothetical protein